MVAIGCLNGVCEGILPGPEIVLYILVESIDWPHCSPFFVLYLVSVLLTIAKVHGGKLLMPLIKVISKILPTVTVTCSSSPVY